MEKNLVKSGSFICHCPLRPPILNVSCFLVKPGAGLCQPVRQVEQYTVDQLICAFAGGLCS